MSEDNQRMPLLSSGNKLSNGQSSSSYIKTSGSGQQISTYSTLDSEYSSNNINNNNSSITFNNNQDNNSYNANGDNQNNRFLDSLSRPFVRQMNRNLGESNGSGGSGGESGLPNTPSTDKKKIIYSHCHVQQESTRGGQDNKGVDKSARRRLVAASIICLLFMIGEVVGGYLSNSLAIATDAAHLLTDFASFMISLFAIWLSSRPATRKMSFGWYRAEVIGALLSVLMIWLVTGLLVYMAVERLRNQQFEIDSVIMVITASAGLLVNIIMAVALNVDGHGHSHGHFHSHGGHSHSHSHSHTHTHTDPHSHYPDNHNSQDNGSHHHNHSDNNNLPKSNFISNGNSKQSTIGLHEQDIEARLLEQQQQQQQHKRNELGRGKSNINVRAAFIHVIGDFLQSLGVLIAALVIHFKPEYAIVDPICTFIFSVIVLVTTINIIRDAINVLMEGMPDGINFIEVRESLQELQSVIRVHNLRIWSLSMDKIAISAHLVIDDRQTPSQVLKAAIEMLKSHYHFFEVTIQVEEYKDDMKDCEQCLEEEVVITGSNESPPERNQL